MLPPIDLVPFRLITLDATGVHEHDGETTAIGPPEWFAVALTDTARYRYLHLIQVDDQSKKFALVMHVDRSSASLRDAARPGEAGAVDRSSASLRDAARPGEAGAVDRSSAMRLPAAGWLSAIMHAPCRVYASDEVLDHAQIAEKIGGHEPPPAEGKPPRTAG